MSKIKYPAEQCLAILRADILPFLRPFCDELKVCGSLRRRKTEVGDIEICYVSKMGEARPEGKLFPEPNQALADCAIAEAIHAGVLALRPKHNGSLTNGQWIKLCVHVASGIPVDFFRCTQAAWWNTVVCRTGARESNIAIAQAAQNREMRWDMSPTSPGFKGKYGQTYQIRSEREAFEYVGLPYLEPEARS